MWKKTLGLDGETYDSQSEAEVANWFLSNDIEYEPHKKLPKPSRSISDFYLPDYDLWVEYDGLMEVRKDNKLKEKEKTYEKLRLKFLVVTRNNWREDILRRMELEE